MRLRACIVRSLVKNCTYGLTVVAAVVAINATTPVERGAFHECFNPHTAQIFTADDARCSENPYLAR